MDTFAAVFRADTSGKPSVSLDVPPTASTFMLLLFQRTLPTPPPPAVGPFVSVAFTVAPPSQNVFPATSPTAFLFRAPAGLLLLPPFALPPFSPKLFAAHNSNPPFS
jgi:hypothetical protein